MAPARLAWYPGSVTNITPSRRTTMSLGESKARAPASASVALDATGVTVRPSSLTFTRRPTGLLSSSKSAFVASSARPSGPPAGLRNSTAVSGGVSRTRVSVVLSFKVKNSALNPVDVARPRRQASRHEAFDRVRHGGAVDPGARVRRVARVELVPAVGRRRRGRRGPRRGRHVWGLRSWRRRGSRVGRDAAARVGGEDGERQKGNGQDLVHDPLAASRVPPTEARGARRAASGRRPPIIILTPTPSIR